MKDKIKNCECAIPEPQSKCSENGVSAYCGKCGKNYNRTKDRGVVI